MVQGDKQIKPSKGGAHRNIGTFFAERGYMVVRPHPSPPCFPCFFLASPLINPGRPQIIPNYRLRIPDTSSPLYSTPQNAAFPSGGIDIALLIRHLSAPSCHISHRIDPASFTLVGNSAGAVHAATYLYRDAIPDFENVLAPLATDPTLIPAGKVLEPSSVMFIGMPAHFRAATPDRNAVLFGYHCPELFGEPGAEKEKEGEMKKLVEERCPVGLRKKSQDVTRVGTMLAELDPETEIAGPVRACISLPSFLFSLRLKAKNLILSSFFNERSPVNSQKCASKSPVNQHRNCLLRGITIFLCRLDWVWVGGRRCGDLSCWDGSSRGESRRGSLERGSLKERERCK